MKQLTRLKIWVKLNHPALNREKIKKEMEKKMKRRDVSIKKKTQKKLFTEFDFLP